MKTPPPQKNALQEYTENLRHYVTTMVCVAVKGRPVAGVIHKPFEDATVWGWAGPRGRNHVNPTLAGEVESNRVRQHRDLSRSRLIVSRSHAGRVHEVAERAFGPEAEVTPAGGAGFKSWEVMKGNQVRRPHTTHYVDRVFFFLTVWLMSCHQIIVCAVLVRT